ncbi:hypothetical protein HOD83_01840 [Candidatus Woesearchaeota archaeon]|jgi:hypothetical protein|nr:hypothetical protein [Candidatus Woesearchaeota archaeon]MBT4114110.1 hypothetical protein [Candidatus Woesearchaeota archaeon]MBT4248307.1 hypothetical protein [Candidatus Woesearchaeota archaeon]
MNKDQKFKQVFEDAKQDKNIIGFFLGGSRGKGRETKHSDYDTYMIVKDAVFKQYQKQYSINSDDIDIMVYSYTTFKEHAELGTECEWNRYNFTHLKALVDKNGKIQQLIDKKGIIPKKILKKYLSGHLDGYINNVYRSFKCFRDKDTIGARLQAAESIPLLLNVIFALDGGRIRPYYKYLVWELEKQPIKKLSIKSQDLIKIILRILRDADQNTQRELFKAVEKALRKEGYGYVYDSWGAGLNLIRKK